MLPHCSRILQSVRLRSVMVGLVATVLCASCTQPEPLPLPPSEVLQRSAVASNTLDSFGFTFDVDLTLFRKQIPTMTGSIRGSGVVRKERSVATGELSVLLSTNASGSLAVSSRIDGAFAIVPQQRPMVRIDGVSTESGGVLLMRDVGKRWISLPLDDDPAPQPSLSAQRVDQQWIGLQASALEVRQDFGIENVGGIRMYHYSVALKQEVIDSLVDSKENGLKSLLRNKLTGDIWIDANSFVLRRASWKLHDLSVDRGALSVHADISVFDHNYAQATVATPLPNAIEYPDDGVFATIFSGALLPFLSW